MENDRRFQAREKTNVPILYAKAHDGLYHQATLYNVSNGGMSFESHHMFFQREYFFIKTNDSFPSFESLKPYDACAAQVKWCEKSDIDSSYKIGIKQVGKAKFVKKEDVHTSTLCCELCANTSIQEVVKTDDHLYLCRNCFTCLSQLPGKALKANLTRFMVGNVI